MTKKPLYLKMIWGFVILSWLLLFGSLTFEPDIKTWTIAVTIVAVITEIGFWLTAGLLGLTMWESRKRIAGLVIKPFSKG